MQKYTYYFLLALVLFGCNSNKEEISSLFSSSIELDKVFSKKLTASSFTEYKVMGKIDGVNYSDYPKNIWKEQGWKVKHWGTIKTEREIRDITSFLTQEKSKYNYNGENKDITLKIDSMIETLKDKSENYLVSYFYKEKPGEDRKAPASNEIYNGWLFFYYLDIGNKKMIRITNAYR